MPRISVEDCIAFSGLSEDEVAAIGEHEHIPTIAASALADYLLKRPHGGEKSAPWSLTIFTKRSAGGGSNTRKNCLWLFAIFSISIRKRVLEWKLKLALIQILAGDPVPKSKFRVLDAALPYKESGPPIAPSHLWPLAMGGRDRTIA
jgi:hypothetical protein